MDYDKQIMLRGYTVIQREEMVEEYLEKVDLMWMIATCNHDLLGLGDVSTGSLIGFHWIENFCPELGDSSALLRQVRDMLHNIPFLLGNGADQMKRNHLRAELENENRAGWELLYLLCKFLGIPAMFLLQQGVFVTQDKIFWLHDQRVILLCGPKERIRALRPKLHNIYGVCEWSTDPVTVREIMKNMPGKGKGKKSGGKSKRKRSSETLHEKTKEILGE